jgi:hypothetical protein
MEQFIMGEAKRRAFASAHDPIQTTILAPRADADSGSFAELRVGSHWKFATSQAGMRLHIEPADNIAALTFIASVSCPTRKEIHSLTKGPIRFGILPSSPLVWFTVEGNGLSFDAPYGIGIETEAEAIAASVACSLSWGPQTRGLVHLIMTDTVTRTITGIRVITLTRAWFVILSEALASCPIRISRSAYDQAMSHDYQRWPSTDAMIACAAIIEQGGF